MPGGDFDGCRFDFRIDSKKGLMPAARRPARNAVREGGAACSTFYSCKHCGVLCATRASLVEHKRLHRSSPSQQKQQHVSQPEVRSSQPSSRTSYPPSLPTFANNEESSPRADITSPTLTSTSSVTSPLTSCAIVLCGSHQLACADRRVNEPQSTIQRYFIGLNQQQQQQQGNEDDKITSLSTKLRDVIASHVAIESSTNSSSSTTTTTKQVKCRQLNAMVERLWKQKLKMTPDLEARPESGLAPAPNERADNISVQQLLVRRVTAAPGSQPQFYTSLMRLQSTRRRDLQQTRGLFKTKKNNINGKSAIQIKDDCGRYQIHSQDGASIDKKQVMMTPETVSAAAAAAAATIVAESKSIIPPVLVSLDNGPNSNCQYVCNFNGCRRMFRELKHLKVHRMQHTNERPLACGICNYACRQRNSLNWHMKSRHGLEKRVTPDGRTVYG